MERDALSEYWFMRFPISSTQHDISVISGYELCSEGEHDRLGFLSGVVQQIRKEAKELYIVLYCPLLYLN